MISVISKRRPRHRFWQLLAAADPWLLATITVAIVAAGVLLVVGHPVTFFLDDWYFIAHRRGLTLHTLLAPHNGHFSLLLVLTYKFLLAVVGMNHVWGFKVALLAMQSSVLVLLFLVARRHVASSSAFLLAAPLALMGAAWSDLFSPFQISFLGSLAFGLAALLMADRRGVRAQGATAALLFGSVAWSGIGLLFLVTVGISALMQRGWRWALGGVGVPAVLYLAWYVGFHQSMPGYGAGQIAPSIWRGVPHAVASYFGASDSFGRVATVSLAAFAIAAVWRRRKASAITIAALAGGIVFLALTGYTRGADSFSQSRYQEPLCVLLVCAVCGLVPRRSPGALVVACGAVLVVVATASGWPDLIAGRDVLVNGDRPVLARLAATEVAQSVISPDFVPSPVDLGGFTAGQYLAMVAAFGSPSPSVEAVEHESPAARGQFDAALLAAESVPAPGGHPGPGCHPAPVHAGLVDIPAGRAIAITAGGRQSTYLGMRRLAPDGVEQRAAVVAPDHKFALQTRPDALAKPWAARPYNAAQVDICP